MGCDQEVIPKNLCMKCCSSNADLCTSGHSDGTIRGSCNRFGIGRRILGKTFGRIQWLMNFQGRLRRKCCQRISCMWCSYRDLVVQMWLRGPEHS